ncbi:MAG: phage tail protein [Tumebacillaceae bacterium]
MTSYSPANVVGAYRYVVEIDGLEVAGFSEVTGIQAETEIEEYVEGGLNGYVHRFAKQTKFPMLVFKRGLTSDSSLWDWYADVMSGTITRKNGAVILNDQSGTEVVRWNFFDAYPVKWNGPEMNASRSEVAIESMELVHNGLKAMFAG